jgi:hypothetical protein
MRNTKTLSILNTLCFLLAFLISNLSQLGVFGNKDIADISRKYETLFTPSGTTFAIWGLIYLSLFVFCFYHLVKAFNSPENNEFNKYTQSIQYYFAINNLAASAWVIAWLNEQLALSVILMLIQLITLLIINIRLHLYNPHTNWAVKLITQMPLSIYFGWICIASIANISAWLVSLNWNGTGISATYWTIILIGLSALLTLFIIFVRRNLFFALVVLWALFGIMQKNKIADPVLYQNIIQAAITAMAIIVLAIIIQSINNIKLSRVDAETPYTT